MHLHDLFQILIDRCSWFRLDISCLLGILENILSRWLNISQIQRIRSSCFPFLSKFISSIFLRLLCLLLHDFIERQWLRLLLLCLRSLFRLFNLSCILILLFLFFNLLSDRFWNISSGELKGEIVSFLIFFGRLFFLRFLGILWIFRLILFLRRYLGSTCLLFLIFQRSPCKWFFHSRCFLVNFYFNCNFLRLISDNLFLFRLFSNGWLFRDSLVFSRFRSFLSLIVLLFLLLIALCSCLLYFLVLRDWICLC